MNELTEQQIAEAVVTMAKDNPWYGYQRIAVMRRREAQPVKNREAYIVMRDHWYTACAIATCNASKQGRRRRW